MVNFRVQDMRGKNDTLAKVGHRRGRDCSVRHRIPYGCHTVVAIEIRENHNLGSSVSHILNTHCDAVVNVRVDSVIVGIGKCCES